MAQQNGDTPNYVGAQASLLRKAISSREISKIPDEELIMFLESVQPLLELFKVNNLDVRQKQFFTSLKDLTVDVKKLSREKLVESVNALIDLLELISKSDSTIILRDSGQSDLAKEFNNIDFSLIIGGPLQAAVQAQAAASLTTVQFIKEIGFKKKEGEQPGELITVDFKFDKITDKKNEKGEPIIEKVDISVPLLSMVNIPTLRIEDVDIAFNAKLNGVESRETKSQFNIGAESKVKLPFVNLKVTASYQRSTTQNVKVEREYTLGVKVKAVQDEIPAGLEKIFNLLAA